VRRTHGILLFAIKGAVSLGLLYVAVRFVNFGALRERLNQLDYAWIAVTLIALTVQVALLSIRWLRIVRSCGGSLSPARAALYTLIGSFFSQVLPSTIGGDAARTWLLARDGGAWRTAIFSVLIDRIAGLIWLAVLVLVCLPWSLSHISNPIARTALILIGAAGAVSPIGLLILSLVNRTPFVRFRIIRHLGDIAKIAWSVLIPARSGVPVACYSIAIHLITVLVLWCCARAIGSSFTVLNSLLLFPPVVLIAAIPVSIAGWGVRESAMMAAFTYSGLPNSDGLLVSILFGASSFIIGALGGIAWSLSPNRVRFRSLREAGDNAGDF
jgi:uncharacterized protein (TIRG00374 family)